MEDGLSDYPGLWETWRATGKSHIESMDAYSWENHIYIYISHKYQKLGDCPASHV